MKEHRFEMGTLPPNPRDFSLSRQDSWAARARSLALAESRPLNRRSGSIPGSPYPPFRWPHFSKNDCVEMDRLKLRSYPESVNDVAGLKRQQCSRPVKLRTSAARSATTTPLHSGHCKHRLSSKKMGSLTTDDSFLGFQASLGS
jgi:hypothetical protein